MNQSMAENFMRSAKAPTISAGVMMAKVIWKVMKTLSGIVPVRLSTVMLPRKTLPRLPTNELNVITSYSIHYTKLYEEFYFGDGIRWMKECDPGTVDVIIVDSTDPVGPAEGLFTRDFYRDCLRALGENGILVQQSESPLFV